MPDPTGHDLIALAQRGEAEAIGALYDQHHEAIFRYIRFKVGEQTLAEDLTGDVFVRMLAALPRYRPTETPFRAWLYRIAHNLVLDYYRTAGNHQSLPETQPDRETALPALLEQKLTLERLQGALTTLEPAQREAVTLRFLGGLSLQETAIVMDKTEAAIKALQHRGLAALRQALAGEGISDE